MNNRKQVLVVGYSQTGQLTKVLQSIVKPLEQNGHGVHFLSLEPIPPYPFPWNFWEFLDCFPETVQLTGCSLKPFELPEPGTIDLVILGYQVWYLSPSPPVVSFLQHDRVRTFLKNKPVVTVVACRNMWIMAHATIQRILKEIGAIHLDHVALIDRAQGFASFVTTPRWLLSGRKDAFWWFPEAGIAQEEIDAAQRFGYAILDAWSRQEDWTQQPMFKGLKAAIPPLNYILPEKMAYRGFRFWSWLIRRWSLPKTWRRKVMLSVYLIILLTYILCAIPFLIALRIILAPLLKSYIRQQQTLFSLPSGLGGERMHLFPPNRVHSSD